MVEYSKMTTKTSTISNIQNYVVINGNTIKGP